MTIFAKQIYSQDYSRFKKKSAKRTSEILTLQQTKIDSFQVELDTIEISVFVYQDYLSTINKFQISNTELEIFYFFENDNLYYCYVQERSPKFKEQSKIRHYYFKDNVLIDTDIRITLPDAPSYSNEIDFDNMFGYNKCLKDDFLVDFFFSCIERFNNNP